MPASTARLGSERIRPEGPSDVYRAIGAVFERYVTPLMAHAALASAAEQIGTSPQALTAAEAPKLVERAMMGVRVFCDCERLPDLMIALVDVLDALAPGE